MKARAVAVAFALALAAPAFGEDSYVIDPTHTFPGFEILHGGFSLQRGSFLGAVGKITLDRAAKKGTVTVTIDAATVDSRMPARDVHLRSERFFDVAKYPTITFKSSDFKFDGDNLVGADGELTMHGVTKPVKLSVANFKCGQSPFNRDKADVRRRNHRHDQAIGMGNHDRHSQYRRRREDRDPDRGDQGITKHRCCMSMRGCQMSPPMLRSPDAFSSIHCLKPREPVARASRCGDASRSCLLLGIDTSVLAAPVDPVYRIDSERTSAGFSVLELGLWQRTGHFGHTRGEIRYDADAESGGIDLAVDAASVDTGWSLRDDFVRGEHMLDAERHPQFRFHSTAMRFDAHRLVAVDGLLTLRDVTLPVRFRVTDVRCEAPRAGGGERCDAAISGSISRRAFGMDFAYPLIGDDVRFDFAVSAERAADARPP